MGGRWARGPVAGCDIERPPNRRSPRRGQARHHCSGHQPGAARRQVWHSFLKIDWLRRGLLPKQLCPLVGLRQLALRLRSVGGNIIAADACPIHAVFMPRRCLGTMLPRQKDTLYLCIGRQEARKTEIEGVMWSGTKVLRYSSRRCGCVHTGMYVLVCGRSLWHTHQSSVILQITHASCARRL